MDHNNQGHGAAHLSLGLLCTHNAKLNYCNDSCCESQRLLVLRLENIGRCEMKYVLLEMDRILRPNGYAIIRESNYYVDAVVVIAKGLRWGCRKEEAEKGFEKEKILICQKKLWYSSNQNSR